MSLKGLFDSVAVTKVVDNKTSEEIGRVVESADYHEADIIDEKRFIPSIDFSDPKNFAKYGSAEKYYEDSYTYIHSSYPYDGSLAEKLQWKNSGSYIDLYTFENKYPRTNGYINFSYGGWGSPGTAPAWPGTAGYGTPQTSDLEYISLNGGPGLGGGIQSQSANVWNPTNNRESNLEADLAEGVTIEFWLKKDAFTTTNTEKEVVLDLWNNELSSSDSYGRLRLEVTGAAGIDSNWLLTIMSGTNGVQWQTLGNTGLSSLTDGNWHHYAFSLLSASAGITAKSYTDGVPQKEETLGSTGINKIRGPMQAQLGALMTSVSGNIYHGLHMTGSGKLSASLDEFRYWKTQRSSEKVGRYWFTQVGGGTNTDLANTDLGVYYKFNEGITQTASVDSVILDYSGRVTNGTWTGYTAGARNTGSAIVSASAAATEFLDPIVYPTHPDVISTLASLKASGSVHDIENPSELFGFFPSWMQDQDPAHGDELKKLTQIISSYLDTLYLQIESFGNIHDITYLSGSATKANTLTEQLLSSKGLLAPELFLDADIFEKLGDRSEEREYRDSLTNIKNKIYQNIYNNLINIYKTKGTRQSFRNVLRCFGVDEKLYKLNVYGDNVQFKIRNNRELYSANKRYINFSVNTNFESTVYLFSNDANSVSYLSSSSELTSGYASTLETYVFFPKKPEAYEKAYSDYQYNYLTSSLFGQHTVRKTNPNSLTWDTPDSTNFQVYAVRDSIGSKDAKFVLTSSAGGVITSPLSTSFYDDVYLNTNWIFGVTIKPAQYPLVNHIYGTKTSDYIIEFKGTQVAAGEVLDSFIVTGSIDASQAGYGFITGSKRPYIGAHRQDYQGTLLNRSDVRVGFCRYWLDDITLDLLEVHGRDIQNYGTKEPTRPPYLFQNNQTINSEFLEIDTLALNWDFETVTGSDASGEFTVPDFSSGSTLAQATQYGVLGNLLAAQHTGYGYGFPVSSTASIDADYVLTSELLDFERLNSSDMISILSTQDDIEFTRESRPINFLYAIEKSMYQSISENMIRMFGVITDFNNIIGNPANKYRDTYKGLRILRERFFERVGNTPDLDKYIEFYKWFDSSLSRILEQLIPAGAEFSKEIRNIIESHMLERSKYQHKFPTMELKDPILVGTVLSPLPLSPGWQYTHHPINDKENTNANYWKSLASRDKGKLATSDTVVNSNKQIYFDNSTKERRTRKEKNVYRFLGNRKKHIRAGITTHDNKIENFVFDATAPYGPVVPGTNIPQNIMLSFNADVEKLQNIADDLAPGKKKRLGFGIDPTINITPGKLKQDGNVLAPFSLYSSSVTNGYNSEVVNFYTASILLTNLHEDIVHTNETRPLQGPFTEKFVGGRQYRHTELNSGSLDTRDDRAEGFRVELGLLPVSPGALGIVPPNYPFGNSPSGSAPLGFLAHLPTAQRLRDEGAKRSVNIKNILMTTASVGVRLSGTLIHNKIGNYSKNYQVVQSSGRTLNDPFFQDQSFDFALNPETAFGRTRHPMELQRVTNTKSVYFDGINDYLSSSVGAAAWNDIIGGAGSLAKAFTFSAWVRPVSMTDNYPRIIDFGGGTSPDRVLAIYGSAYPATAQIYLYSGQAMRSSAASIVADNWVHIVGTYAGGSSGDINIYINGVKDNATHTDLPDTTDIGSHLSIGADADGTGDEFNGYVNDAAIWSRELTESEVTILYNNGHQPDLQACELARGLVSWYRMGDGDDDTNTTIYDQMGFANLTAVNGPTIQSSAPSPIVESSLNYALPDRTGANSNKTVIVNRFSAPGGYKTLSRGYLDPAHEEKSVYNVLPYRNLSVLNFGTIVSSSNDNSVAFTMHVEDQSVEGVDRGLRQRLVPHNRPFGYDGAYTAYPAYYKVNRNRRRQMKEGNSFVTASVYDNWYVHHPIPRSEQQYSWIAASIASGSSIFGYSTLSGGVFVESLPLISASDLGTFNNPFVSGGPFYAVSKKDRSHSSNYAWKSIDFAGLSTVIVDPVTSSLNTLGYPTLTLDINGTFASSNYLNKSAVPGFNGRGIVTNATVRALGAGTLLNSILVNRNGPYGWPTWKQIRTEEHPVVRTQEKNSILSIRTKTSTDVRIGASRGNALTQFIEPQVYASEFPMIHEFNMGTSLSEGAASGTPVRLTLKNSYANKLINFANYEVNNILNIARNYDSGDLYFNRINSMILEGQNNDSALKSALSKVSVTYAQAVYPATYNAFLERTRSRKYYTISNIWNNKRSMRSFRPQTNSQGTLISAATPPYGMSKQPSVWPVDGHLDYSSSVSWTEDDGAGELQNSYSRYRVHYGGNGKHSDLMIIPAATYNARVPHGEVSASSGVGVRVAFPGDRYNLVAGSFSGTLGTAGSGKSPYKSYEDYAKYMRLIGKDYSIVPEFRISEHIAEFLTGDDFATLTSIDDLLSLTGSAYVNSSESGFYKEYANSDFMKMFSVVNNAYHGAELVDGSKMSQDKIGLRCTALVQFLPYKGFYPAERTVQLASLFSQSFGDEIYVSASGRAQSACYRAILEPLYSQGIMYNTIKSGIAVSNFIISNTSSVESPIFPMAYQWATGAIGGSTRIVGNLKGPSSGLSASCVYNNYNSSLPEGNLFFRQMLPPWSSTNGAASSSYLNENGYFHRKIPFEALYKPRNYLSQDYISYTGRIYDTGLSSASLNTITPASDTSNWLTWNGEGDSRYELAIDNFLCETVNFFQNGLTSILSDREENFRAAESGSTYTMKLKLYRPTTLSPGYDWANTGALIPDHAKFDMYRRISAFGPPMAAKDWDVKSPWRGSASYGTSFSHLTPPYYAGSGSCTFTFTATYDGTPSLDEIFVGTSLVYDRMETVELQNGNQPMGNYKVQMYDSFNLTESVASVPANSRTQKKQWLIQSKFETPVINIAGDRRTCVSGAYPGVKARGGIKINGSVNLDDTFGFVGSSGAEYNFIIKGAYNGATDPIQIERNADADKMALNIHGAITASNFVTVDGGIAVIYPATLSLVVLTQSAVGTAGNTPISKDGGEIETYEFNSGENYIAEDPCGDIYGSIPIASAPDTIFPAASINMTGTLGNTITPNSELFTQGLWHDYGSIPTGSDEGVFAIIESPSPKIGKSLAELVGMPIGQPFRIGAIKPRAILEEAVVAVPFFVGGDSRRKFYKLDSLSKNSVKKLSRHMKKYIFPPRFDFVLNEEMDPVAMYVFEFSRQIGQQDIADMWQNLPPSIHETFEQKVSIIEHKLLRDQMLNKENRKLRKDLRWLVFKVKKRAETDYSRFTKKGLVSDLETIPSNIGNAKYSYNWPYDYFSLVELVKIDEAIEYDSQLPPDSRVAIVGEVNIEEEPVFDELE